MTVIIIVSLHILSRAIHQSISDFELNYLHELYAVSLNEVSASRAMVKYLTHFNLGILELSLIFSRDKDYFQKKNILKKIRTI